MSEIDKIKDVEILRIDKIEKRSGKSTFIYFCVDGKETWYCMPDSLIYQLMSDHVVKYSKHHDDEQNY